MLAADHRSALPVFVGAAAALVVVTLGSALLGDALGSAVPQRTIHVAAGGAFLVLGALLLTGWV
jgi:putative Ca2+/H+ antiporter (TMEM165/GDT1 family)